MGLPAYVINFDELKQPILEAINEAAINITVDNVSLDSTSVTIDTSKIEESLKGITTKLNSVNDNTILINETVTSIIGAIQAHDSSMGGYFNNLGKKVEDMIKTMLDMHSIMERISEQLAANGKQRMVGEQIAIPSIKNTMVKTVKIDKDALFTGFTTSQSAWNDGDSWSLSIGDFKMFSNIYTKRKGEHKQLSKFFPIPANTEVKFEYTNTSGNSKIVWLDVEYIEVPPKVEGGI